MNSDHVAHWKNTHTSLHCIAIASPRHAIALWCMPAKSHSICKTSDLSFRHFSSCGTSSVDRRLNFADEVKLAKMLDFFPLRERHGRGGLRRDEHLAAVFANLFRCVAGVFGQFETLRPVINLIRRIRVADLNAEKCSHLCLCLGDCPGCLWGALVINAGRVC